MKKAIHSELNTQVVSEPTQIAPEPESVPLPDVLVLPAEYFFIEKVEVPAALSPAELSDFAELSMEAVSPFPLDQLRWGFSSAPDGQHLLIYAALKDRLKVAGHTELESYTWVLPDFTSLNGARFTRDTEVVLEGEAQLLPSPLPSYPCSHPPLPTSSTPAGLLSADRMHHQVGCALALRRRHARAQVRGE